MSAIRTDRRRGATRRTREQSHRKSCRNAQPPGLAQPGPVGRHAGLPSRCTVRAAVAAVLVASLAPAAHANPVAWIGGDGFWDVAGNWNPGVPAAGADVTVNVDGSTIRTVTVRSGQQAANSLASAENLTLTGNGTRLSVAGAYSNSALTTVTAGSQLTLNGSSALTALTQTGGVLDGTGVVTVQGAASLTGGSQTGAGQTILNGPATLGGFSLADNRLLVLNGGGTIAAGSQVSLDGTSGVTGGGTLRNAAGSTLTDAGGSFFGTSSGEGLVDNRGVYRKVGTGATSVGVAFENTGELDLQTGTLAMNRSSNLAGTVRMAAGTTLQYGLGTHALAGAALVGAANSTVRVSGGNVTVAGPVALRNVELTNGTLSATDAGTTLDRLTIGGGNFVFGGTDTIDSLAMSSGGVLEGSGVLTVAGPTTLTGGIQRGAGQTLLNGPISASGIHTVDSGRIVTLGGDTSLAANGMQWTINGGATLRNAAGATYADTTTAGHFFTTGSNGVFENRGTYRKMGTGLSTINSGFVNSGLFDLRAGRTIIRGTGAQTGTIAVANGAILEYDLGAHALQGSGLQLAQGSLFRVVGANVTVDGAAAFGNVELTGNGSLRAGALGTTLDNLTLGSLGLFEFNGTDSIGTLTQSGGSTLVGTGVLTVTGAATFSGGFQRGAGQTLLNGTTNFVSGTNLGDGRLMVVNGGATTGSFFQFNLGSAGATGGTLRNAAGSLWIDSQTGGGHFSTSSGQGVLENLGEYRKTGSGRTQIATEIRNSGLIDVRGGQLALSRAGTVGGRLQIGPGGTLELDNGNYAFDDFVQTGGQVVLTGNSPGGGRTTIEGVAELHGGWTGSGETVVQRTAAFGPSYTLANGRTLTLNGGARTVDGAFTFDLDDSNGLHSGTLRNVAGATFEDRAASASRIDSSNPGGRFLNDGTYLKTGAGTTTVGASFTNGGTVELRNGGDLFLDGPVTNLAGGTLTGGTWRVFGNSDLRFAGGPIVTNAADVTLSGANSRLRSGANALESTLATNAAAGRLRILDGRDYAATANSGNFANAGLVQLGGGTFTAGSVANAGTLEGHGAVAGPVANTGTVRATGGTLASQPITGLTGTVRIDAGARLDLGGTAGNSSAGVLDHQGAGLALGANDVLVRGDYRNAAFGSGEAFDARANVTGTGRILAENAGQAIAGSGVTNASGANPTIALGNVRVGDTASREVAVTNTGTLTTLRGAVQTAGATGVAVTGAGDFVLNPGQSQSLNLGFTATRAGALDGQSIRVVNNFDNVADQTVGLTGNAFAVANPILSADLSFGNVRLGERHTRTITVENRLLPGVLAQFQEGLNASFGSMAAGFTGSGAVTNLGAGQGDSTTLVVTLDTTSAGSRRGQVEVRLASNGATTSGLGVLDLGSQFFSATASVDGAVFRQAEAQVTGSTGRLTARVGDALSRTFRIANVAVADGYSESLGVTGTASGDGVAFGPANGLIAAGTSRDVTATVDTRTAGTKSGRLDLAFTSDGRGTSGAPAIAIGNQSVAVEADVYAAAVADVSTRTIDFGTVRVGDAIPVRELGIANGAQGALADTLVTTVGAAPSSFTAGAAPGPLAAGQRGAIGVRLDTSAAGSFAGSLALDFVSRNPVLSDLRLAPHTVQLTGTVNNRANAAFSLGGSTLTFDSGLGGYVFDAGELQLGASISFEGFRILNAVSGPADALSGRVTDANAADAFTLTGDTTVAPLAAGQSSGTFGVRVDTSREGVHSGMLQFTGVGTNASDPVGEARQARLFLRARVALLELRAPDRLSCAGGLGLNAVNGALRSRRGSSDLVAGITRLGGGGATPSAAALERVGPQAYASALQIGRDHAHLIVDSLRTGVRGGAGEGTGSHAFGQFLRGSADRGGDGCASGYDLDTNGLLGGFETRGESFAAAAFFGTLDTDQRFGALGARTEASGAFAGLRAGTRLGDYELAAIFVYDDSEGETVRSGADAAALKSGEYDVGGWSADLSLSRRARFGRVSVTPTFGLTYSSLERDAVRETGSPFALAVERAAEDLLRADASVALSTSFEGRDGVRWTPSLSLGVRHGLEAGDAVARARFANSPEAGRFAQGGAAGSRTETLVGVGLGVDLNQQVRLYADYRGEFGDGEDRRAGVAGVAVRF